jgi:lipopolysaccharide biosynthesis glycosyltransferase
MKRVVLALVSNERYFPGLYCAVASALSHLDAARELNLKVLDGGISQTSRDILERLVNGFGKPVRLELLPINESVFRGATLGPGQSHMAYCRILLPHLLDVSRLIYLDCDVLVFRDLSELFDMELACGKVIAAVRDSETSSLAEDSRIIADAMKLSADSTYFNSGVLLLNLHELRKENFTERSVDFFKQWSGHYRFHDQSAINFLLCGQIHTLPEYWNRASWQFDEQDENDLSCVLHYTRSAPWLRETPGPAQALFERFAAHAGVAVNRRTTEFKHSQHQWFWRHALAPVRAAAFSMASILYKISGRGKRAADYQRAARYWFDYVRKAPGRRRIHRRRIAEIQNMKFDAATSEM